MRRQKGAAQISTTISCHAAVGICGIVQRSVETLVDLSYICDVPTALHGPEQRHFPKLPYLASGLAAAGGLTRQKCSKGTEELQPLRHLSLKLRP